MTTENLPVTTEKSTSRTLKDYIGLVARGFAMGSADVVPGVSGGTMAFILGIYEELITSIRDLLSPTAARFLLRFKIKAALDVLPWQFLLAVGFGIILAIFTLAPYLEYMLENQPVFLWSFFFGLVAASIITVSKKVSRWGATTIVAAIIGAVVAYLIVGLVPAETPNSAWFLFLSGFIASCAMILPGISGSFILLLLGKYQTVLSAVNNRDFVVLFIVALGVAAGIVTIAQLLSWLFKRYRDLTVAVLIGLMAGSLRKIWPWKEAVDVPGEPLPELVNVLPATWTTEVTIAVVLVIVGFGLVFVLDSWATRKEKKTEAPA
jgi:putative membrane protein